MREHRFIDNFDFNDKDLKIIDINIVNQIKNVLRFNPGDQVVLGNGKMEEVIAEIMAISKDFVQVKILEVRLNKNEPFKNIILYCAILKRENFELVCQKAVETGVCEIVPVICSRTVKFGLKEERLKKIIKEAAEQTGRGIVPKLSQTVSLGKAMTQARDNDFNLFFDLSGTDLAKIKSALAEAKRIGIFIGPEGGWEEKEIEAARNGKNFKIVHMGKLTLRAETAAIVAAYLAGNL